MGLPFSMHPIAEKGCSRKLKACGGIEKAGAVRRPRPVGKVTAPSKAPN